MWFRELSFVLTANVQFSGEGACTYVPVLGVGKCHCEGSYVIIVFIIFSLSVSSIHGWPHRQYCAHSVVWKSLKAVKGKLVLLMFKLSVYFLVWICVEIVDSNVAVKSLLIDLID